MTLEYVGDAAYSLRVSGRSTGPALLATLSGWMGVIAELLKMKNGKVVHSRRCSRGGKTCAWTLSWEL